MLSPLLTFIRLARSAGAVEIIDRTGGQIEAALNGVVTDDAVSAAPGEPPSLVYSTLAAATLADLLGDTNERERLAPIVGSRLWEILQLNPRKEVLALLDCYLAAVRIGERESA